MIRLSQMGGAVVTGGGGGLGLAIAQQLAARGLTVHVTDVEEGSASAAADGIGQGAWASTLDVRDESACRRIAAETVERAGSLDVWVNNAGILIPGLVFEQGLEAHRAMLEVNAVGTYNGTIAALELMVPRQHGHVINIISLAGLVAAPGLVGYAASKHAAIAFTIGTAADLRRSGVDGVHVSAVCPDGIWSPMITDKLDDPNDAASFSGKMLMPDQVAEKVMGLLDRPRPVLVIPRWRGRVARFLDRHPRLAIAMTPWAMRDAERRQRRFKQRVEAGKWPPPKRQ